MFDSVNSRHKDYEKSSDFEIIKKIPVIISVNGRAFSRFTRNLKRPYEPLLLEAMAETMFFVISEMTGAVFGYQQNDKITFILRNDQTPESEPWYGNKIQKLCSVTSSLTTLGFYKAIQKIEPKLSTIGEPIFDVHVSSRPSISECLSHLICQQQECNSTAVSSAVLTLLSKKIGKKAALHFLQGKSKAEKISILLDDCEVDFDQEFPASFRLGIGAYKVPFIIPSKNGDTTRKKWILDWDFPLISENKDIIHNILFTGSDIVRGEHISDLYEDEDV